jgi:hypothetical protein
MALINRLSFYRADGNPLYKETLEAEEDNYHG